MKRKIFLTVLLCFIMAVSPFTVGCGKKTPFTVVFDGNGGTLVSGEEVQQVVSAKDIKAPTYDMRGYSFTWDKDISKIEEDCVVKAVWKAKTYTLVFDADGGSCDTSQTSVKYGDNVTGLPVPTKGGYVFNGWRFYDSQNDELKEYLNDGQKWDYIINRQVKAQWEEADYSITYNINGASGFETTKRSYKISDSDFTLDIPTREGYNFDGWVKSGETQAVREVVIENGSSGNLTFNAQWSKIEVVVNFDFNSVASKLDGGTTAESITINYGDKLETKYIAIKSVNDGNVYWAVEQDGVCKIIDANTVFNSENVFMSNIGTETVVKYNVQLVAKKIDVKLKFDLTYKVDGVNYACTVGGSNSVADMQLVIGQALGDLPVAKCNSDDCRFGGYWVIYISEDSEIKIEATTVFNIELANKAVNGVLTVKPKLLSNWTKNY